VFGLLSLAVISDHDRVAYGVLFVASDEASFVTGAELVKAAAARWQDAVAVA
jgi:hypothetical protein